MFILTAYAKCRIRAGAEKDPRVLPYRDLTHKIYRDLDITGIGSGFEISGPVYIATLNFRTLAGVENTRLDGYYLRKRKIRNSAHMERIQGAAVVCTAAVGVGNISNIPTTFYTYSDLRHCSYG